MSHPPPKKPDISITPVPRTPSEWSPRSIPVPAPGRSTADPRTPTLRELRAREAERASLLAGAQAVWLELAYTHPVDGGPMAGAPYRARFADGSAREGRLADDGAARLDGLPAALAGTAVEVRFGEPAPAFRAFPAHPAADTPNPDYRPDPLAVLRAPPGPTYAAAGPLGAGPVTPASWRPGGADVPHGPSAGDAGLGSGDAPAGLRGLAAAVAAAPGVVEDALEYLWALVAGAYKQDPTTGEIVGQTVVAMVPGLGQVADVRDLSAYVYQLTRPDLAPDAERAAWTGVVLAGVALALPVVGAAVAGAGRAVLRGGPGAERLVVRLLRRAGHGDVLRFGARELSAGRLEELAIRAFQRVVGYLERFFAAVRDTWVPVADAVRAAARRALDALGRLRARATAAIREVAARIAVKVRPLLSKAAEEGEQAGGAVSSRVAKEAEAEAAARGPAPEGPEGPRGKEPAGAGRAFSPAQREMVDEMRRNGVKFDPDKLVDVRRMPDGRVVFLEKGDARRGLEHIRARHADDFARRGVQPDQISGVVMDALERGKVVGYQGQGSGRPVYEVLVNGRPQRIAITTGSNGYVVGANPN